MNAQQVYEALVLGGHLSPDPEDICAEAQRQAELEDNSYWVRALLYRLPQIVDEYTYLLDDAEDEEILGLDAETKARMERAAPKDYIGEEVVE